MPNNKINIILFYMPQYGERNSRVRISSGLIPLEERVSIKILLVPEEIVSEGHA